MKMTIIYSAFNKETVVILHRSLKFAIKTNPDWFISVFEFWIVRFFPPGRRGKN